jgi:hypothetical protein
VALLAPRAVVISVLGNRRSAKALRAIPVGAQMACEKLCQGRIKEACLPILSNTAQEGKPTLPWTNCLLIVLFGPSPEQGYNRATMTVLERRGR